MRLLKRVSEAGFTVAKLLAALAVLTVLFAAAAPDAVFTVRRLRLIRLDSAAEDIFVSVQNELTAARCAGKPLDFGGKSVPVNTVSYKGVRPDVTSIHIVSVISERGDGTAAVEYDAVSGEVYGVFYSDVVFLDYDPMFPEKIPRSFEQRLRLGTQVGYFGGEAQEKPEGKKAPVPVVRIINGEKLAVRVSADCTGAVGFSLYISGGESRVEIVPEYAGCFIVGGNTATVILDSLLPGQGDDGGKSSLPEDKNMSGYVLERSFSDWVSDSDGGLLIEPGDDITVTAVFHFEGAAPSAVSKTVNSYFESLTDGRAAISCGRHLQHLTDCISVGKVTSAELTSDIDFKDSGDNENYGSWNSGITYANGYAFKPIDCSAGLSGGFSGNDHTISGLKIDGSSDSEYGAGLFSGIMGCRCSDIIFRHPTIVGDDEPAGVLCGYSFYAAFENIIIEDPEVSTRGCAGGVAGMCSFSSAKGVFVYSDCENYERRAIKSFGTDSYAGGYFGYADGVSVSDGGSSVKVISECFAGGLTGCAEKGCEVSGTYVGGHTFNGRFCGVSDEGKRFALINVYGGEGAGGFAGKSQEISLTECYTTCSVSSGDIENADAFAGMGIYYAESCYTLARVIDADGVEMKKAPKNENVATESDEISDTEKMASALPYDGFLKELYGGKYPYASRTVHIGDWPA